MKLLPLLYSYCSCYASAAPHAYVSVASSLPVLTQPCKQLSSYLSTCRPRQVAHLFRVTEGAEVGPVFVLLLAVTYECGPPVEAFQACGTQLRVAGRG